MEGVSSEESRCTLVGELVQVLEIVRQLDAHMTGMQLGGGGGWVAGGEERCRALMATMRASIDRSVHIARSFYAAEAAGGRLLPVFAAGQPDSPPSAGGGDGSPRSTGSDQAAGESRGRGIATGQSKKRKTLPKWSTKVRVSAVQDVTPLDDGLSWRKYGQKDILGAKYPRAYFRCTHRHTQGCQASKQVQRADGDPLLFDVVYHGDHTCAQVQAQAAAHLGNTTANAENSQQQPQSAAGLEQATSASSSQMFERTVLPMIPTNNKPAANDSACETGGGFPAAGCLIAASSGFTATATTKPESQLVSSSGSNHTAVGAPPNDVPEVQLASTTNSPIMGDDMDFLFSLDDAAGFLENTSYNF